MQTFHLSSTSSLPRVLTNFQSFSTIYIPYFLDDAEKAMRAMDKSGRGFLTNDKVFGLMQQQMEQQKQLFKFKKIIIG